LYLQPQFSILILMIIYPVLAALFIMLASLIGIVFSWKTLGGWMTRNLPFLATFSIGIFAVVTWGLFGEAIEHASWLVILISVLCGAVLVKLLSYLVPDAHHHHEPHPEHGHTQLDARRIIMGDAVHNIGDGLLLVPAFLADIHLGIAVAVGIFLHELVQEVSEFFILKEAGYTTKQALVRNFITSGTILIGVFLSTYLSSIEYLEAPLIGLSAGGFLYVILRDLVPHTIASIRTKGRGDRHVEALVFGILIMLGANAIIPHTHEEHVEEIHEEETVIEQ
jgi:zinc and cadmium transporter